MTARRGTDRERSGVAAGLTGTVVVHAVAIGLVWTTVKPIDIRKPSPRSASVTGSLVPPRLKPVNTVLRPRLSTSTRAMPLDLAASIGRRM